MTNRPELVRSTAGGVAIVTMLFAAPAAPASPESRQRTREAFGFAYALNFVEAYAAFGEAVTLDPDDPAPPRGIAAVVWIETLFTPGAATFEAFTGQVSSKSDVERAPRPFPLFETGSVYMNSIFGQSILATAIVLTVSPAAAQTPQRGSSAIGVEVGPFVPAAETIPLDGIDRATPIVQVFYHTYLASRTSLRFGAGTTNPKRDVYPRGPAVRYIRAGVDVVHKSERSLYVGAGVGIYSLRGPFDRVADGHRTVLKPGGTLFVGGEYFIRDTVSLTVEGRLHALRKVGDFAATGLTPTFGVKKHF